MRASYTGRSFASRKRYPGGCSFLSDNAAAISDKMKGARCKFWFNLSPLSWGGGVNLFWNPKVKIGTSHFATPSLEGLPLLLAKHTFRCTTVVSRMTPCNLVKTVSLQAWTGPEVSRKLRLPDFVTAAQDGGKVVSLTHRPLLPPGNTPGIHFCSKLSRSQGHSAIGRILCQWRIHWHQLGSNKRPSDL